MLIRRKPGRLRATIAVVALAAAGLATASTSTPAVAAAADADCTPIGPTPPGFGWAPISNERGVTLCQGADPINGIGAYVQIVDLSAGARVRLLSNACDGCPTSDLSGRATDKKFNVRTASEWFDWIKSDTVFDPSPSRLFSTTNASFFTDASGAPSPLSLPYWNHIVDSPANCIYQPVPGCTIHERHTWGWAFAHNDDPAWNSPKRALILEDTNSPRQQTQAVHLEDFPTNYTDSDVDGVHGFSPFDLERIEGDSTVGFMPNFDGGTGQARRTYVGTSGDALGVTTKVYILASSRELTVTEAQNILQAFGSEGEIQLDGGGSTQMTAETSVGSFGISSPIFRKVPNVLAVYLAP